MTKQLPHNGREFEYRACCAGKRTGEGVAFADAEGSGIDGAGGALD
jgi:hypothetical protein